MLKKLQICFIIFFILLIGYSFSFGDVPDEEKKFFSYERLFLNQAIINKIPSDSKAQRDVKAFAENYTNGIYELSAGNLDAAKKDFITARKTWSEHYGSDFLLGLVYESSGNYKKAARYYKSYLNKLRDFHSGTYRLSSPIIRSLAYFDVEDYDESYILIRNHMARYGINIDKVKPAATHSLLIISLIIAAIITAISLVMSRVVLPYVKRQHYIKNPPEGYWVCKHCGTDNPELAIECEECRKPRE